MAAAESSTSEDRTCPQCHSRSNAINGIEADPWNRREIQSERKRVDSVAGDDGNTALNREKSWLTLTLFTPGYSINSDRSLEMLEDGYRARDWILCVLQFGGYINWDREDCARR